MGGENYALTVSCSFYAGYIDSAEFGTTVSSASTISQVRRRVPAPEVSTIGMRARRPPQDSPGCYRLPTAASARDAGAAAATASASPTGPQFRREPRADGITTSLGDGKQIERVTRSSSLHCCAGLQ